MSTASDPRGNLLMVNRRLDGHSSVVIDNGPFRTITLLCRTEDLGALLDADTRLIQNHLMSRKPGRIRRKRT
jgi:hypothetical protein